MSIQPARRKAALTNTAREPVATPVEPPPAPMPEAVEFVRFCYRRSGVTWPALYDEMCAVAARGTFRGLEYEGLSDLGISFALPELPRLASIVERVVEEERAARPTMTGWRLKTAATV
ncbi:MAG: hypothetical protein H0U80_03425 [Solirubrobacterales bacterium]|nr:hypothetical protein [Solirubrobacterales bacterium]